MHAPAVYLVLVCLKSDPLCGYFGSPFESNDWKVLEPPLSSQAECIKRGKSTLRLLESLRHRKLDDEFAFRCDELGVGMGKVMHLR
ncbi:hypothetical protein SAMN05519104_1195 [Rhizobiales bacterium GAS188]|nr:hypothetical protein SAMN05519104_1195 [Rhizobiales bacterium GAS188]